jgi:hypothetical protein
LMSQIDHFLSTLELDLAFSDLVLQLVVSFLSALFGERSQRDRTQKIGI